MSLGGFERFHVILLRFRLVCDFVLFCLIWWGFRVVNSFELRNFVAISRDLSESLVVLLCDSE